MVENSGRRPTYDDVLKRIFKLVYIRPAIMVAFCTMGTEKHFQRYFQNSGNFGGIKSNRPFSIPEPDKGLDVSGFCKSLKVSQGSDEIDLILADAQLFFQFPESGCNRTGVSTFHMASRQCHLISPGVAFRI